MGEITKVDDESLDRLKNALATAGESYKSNLTKLQSVIEEITAGDIKGDPATELLNKFNSKREVFKAIEATINEAEDYTGVKKSKFTSLIGDISAGMR